MVVGAEVCCYAWSRVVDCRVCLLHCLASPSSFVGSGRSCLRYAWSRAVHNRALSPLPTLWVSHPVVSSSSYLCCLCSGEVCYRWLTDLPASEATSWAGRLWLVVLFRTLGEDPTPISRRLFRVVVEETRPHLNQLFPLIKMRFIV